MKRLILITTVIFLLSVSAFALQRGSFATMLSADFVSKPDQTFTDEEYEKLGEDRMEKMTGEQHRAMDEQMQQMMGEDFLRQVHIAMGKQAQNPGRFGMMPVMGMMSGGNMMGGWAAGPFVAGWKPYSGLINVLALVTWLSLIAFLLAGARWFWKKGNK